MILHLRLKADVQEIVEVLPKQRQTLASSATYPSWMRRQLAVVMLNPAYIAKVVVVEREGIGRDGEEIGAGECVQDQAIISL